MNKRLLYIFKCIIFFLQTLIISTDGSVRIQPKKKKKYKKKATKPARPKPGQVVIASAADGSPIFCCPQCQMAYPEKEQLEMHLTVHEIERRFICGICGAGYVFVYILYPKNKNKYQSRI